MLTEKTKSKLIKEEDGATLEIFPVSTEEAILFDLFKTIFENYWDQIRFGPLIQGAAWEVGASHAPTKVALMDGYLTVDFGLWHFHICIGENKGTKEFPTPPELTQHRKTTRAEFYRRLNTKGIPSSWGFRAFNGKNEQQITVFFPNPNYDLFPKFIKHEEPKWEKLEMWNTLRKKYLNMDPDPQCLMTTD